MKPQAGKWRAHVLRLAIVLFPLAFGIQRANASLWVHTTNTLEDRANRADAIPMGTVVGVDSFWQEGRIVSQVTFSVRDTLKGRLPSQVTVLASGGKVGDIRMHVSGAPEFAPGDNSVLFLRSLADNPAAPHYAVLDRELGKVDIGFDESGQETVSLVRPELRRVDRVRLTEFAERVTTALRAARP